MHVKNGIHAYDDIRKKVFSIFKTYCHQSSWKQYVHCLYHVKEIYFVCQISEGIGCTSLY